MNALLLPLSILCGLILCSTAVSLFAVYRAHCLLREMKVRAGTRQPQEDTGIQALRDTVEALAAQIHDLQKHPLVAPLPGMPKPGLNLNKRSHALRAEGTSPPKRAYIVLPWFAARTDDFILSRAPGLQMLSIAFARVNHGKTRHSGWARGRLPVFYTILAHEGMLIKS